MFWLRAYPIIWLQGKKCTGLYDVFIYLLLFIIYFFFWYGITNKAWQVVELQESKNNLLQENQQLMENKSSLHLQMNDLQSIASAQSSEEFTKVCVSN